MSDFIHTGFYAPTMTTVDDPLLRVIEVDNGNSWLIKFYCSNTLIDVINLEHFNGSQLDENVLDLTVHNEEHQYLGTVRERIENAFVNQLNS